MIVSTTPIAIHPSSAITTGAANRSNGLSSSLIPALLFFTFIPYLQPGNGLILRPSLQAFLPPHSVPIAKTVQIVYSPLLNLCRLRN
jgi:hypothetical protein